MRLGSIIALALCPDLYDANTDNYALKIAVLCMAVFLDLMVRLGIIVCVVFFLSTCYDAMVIANLEDYQNQDLEAPPAQSRHRSRRDRPVNSGNATDHEKICGATSIRLNLDLNRIYGEWYPAEASQMSYQLWVTSLYGFKNGSELTSIICPTMKLSPGPEARTLNIVLAHKDKTMMAQAALLGDAHHPGTSKWVVSWPNGEDTLTSIVACGSTEKTEGAGEVLDWMLTVDCDLKGAASPDWTIFARQKQGLPSSTIKAIKSIVDGIAGLRATNAKKLSPESCA